MRLAASFVCLVACTSTEQQAPLPTAIASGQQNPSSIATTSTDVYWVDVPEFADATMTGRIMRAPIAGGAVDTFADAQPCPVAVATEPSAVYWIRCDGAVLTAPATGGTARVMLAPSNVGNFHPIALATTTEYVYVLSQATMGASGAIVRVWKEPGIAAEVTAINLSNPVALAADSTNLYWIDVTDGALYRRTAAVGLGMPPTLVASPISGSALVVDANRIYYVDFGALGDKQVHSVPISGGDIVDYDTQGSSATAVAIDANAVYWLAPGMEAVSAAPLAGGPTRTIARLVGSAANAIAVSDDAVFFADDPTSASGTPTTLESAAKAAR